MLIVDDNMFKLAKMQEALLKVSNSNVDDNLNKYKSTVIEIDKKAYDAVLEQSRHIDRHNQTLEEELDFLESIKNAYEQLFELQMSFKNICERYGDDTLLLSDLSKLNIEYIENRVNAIKGYLLNKKNIETNKERLQDLNEQLVSEEKSKLTIDQKLLSLEDELRNSFISAEGRNLKDGNLQYTSISDEYKRIDLDLDLLLDNIDLLKEILLRVESEQIEAAEKVRAAEICYSSILTSESRQMLEDANIELLNVKYRIAMLKMIELLHENNDDYDLFIEKRKTLLDLIRFRLSCCEKLGIKVSIDPFSRIKVREQMEMVLALPNNSKKISRIRKEISQLNSWTEEMLSQNSGYLLTLNDTRKIIEDNMSMNDVDITPITTFEEFAAKKEVKNNQVVRVRNVLSKFNMSRARQKTLLVIKRVNDMMGTTHTEEIVQSVDDSVVPELVISPVISNMVDMEQPEEIMVGTIPETEEILFEEDDTVAFEDEDIVFGEEEVLTLPEEQVDTNGLVDVPLQPVLSDNVDLFETVNPFEEPILFNDKVEFFVPEAEVVSSELQVPSLPEMFSVEEKKEPTLGLVDAEGTDAMPEAFWVTQDDNSLIENEDNIISFDEQINALLASDDAAEVKIKRKVA